MGYDVNVIDDDYHRWFSIWNWHRCLAFALYGCGELTINELESELRVALDLQNWDQNKMTPEEEEKREAIAVKQIKPKKDEVNVIHVNLIYADDDKLRITGGMAAIPVSGEIDKETASQQSEALMAMIRLQQETNRLCLDKLANISVTRKEAHDFGTMEGDKISPLTCAKLWFGAMVGLACYTPDPKPDELTRSMFASFVKDVANWSDAKLKRKRAEFNFELAEYWGDDELGALPAFVGILAQAVGNETGILIT